MNELVQIVNNLDNKAKDIYEKEMKISEEKEEKEKIRLRKEKRKDLEEFKKIAKEGFEKVKQIENIVEYENIVDISKIIGAYFQTQGVNTTKIRKFLDAVRKLQAEINKKSPSDKEKENKDLRLEILMLKPKIAYTAAKHKQLKPFVKIINHFIDEVYNNSSPNFIDRNSFQKLVYFIESIVAYHRFYGGKD